MGFDNPMKYSFLRTNFSSSVLFELMKIQINFIPLAQNIKKLRFSFTTRLQSKQLKPPKSVIRFPSPDDCKNIDKNLLQKMGCDEPEGRALKAKCDPPSIINR